MRLEEQPPVYFDPDDPDREHFPLPKRVSIETSSNCNRRCPFCPVSHGRRDFPTVLMSDALYLKLIKELYDLEWNGNLQLFFLNEPLLDPDLKRKAAFARRNLPRCTTYISTNGDAVDFRTTKTVDWSVEKLMTYYDAGITTINLNIYDSGERQADRYRRIVERITSLGLARFTEHKYTKLSPKYNWIALTDMRPERLSPSVTDMFYTRTDVERADIVQVKDAYCARTQRHFVILYDGRVPVCCAADPTSPETPVMGDVNYQSIREIWDTENFYKYRYYTQFAKRVLPVCDTCNHRMAYAHVVRQVDAPEAVRRRWSVELSEYRAQRFVQLRSRSAAEGGLVSKALDATTGQAVEVVTPSEAATRG